MVGLVNQTFEVFLGKEIELMFIGEFIKLFTEIISADAVTRAVFDDHMPSRFQYLFLYLIEKRLAFFADGNEDDISLLYPLPVAKGEIDEEVRIFIQYFL